MKFNDENCGFIIPIWAFVSILITFLLAVNFGKYAAIGSFLVILFGTLGLLSFDTKVSKKNDKQS